MQSINLLKNKTLILIFLVGLFLRFYKLGQIPNGFYVDEAMIGYNAYSFLQTGFRDEYGKFLPVFLRSYSVYSPPLYSYITAFFIKLFGLSIFSVRFLSALSGSLSIIAIFYLANILFKNKFVSLVSALIFAISPWSMFFSRGAFEVNLSVFILLISLCFLIKSLKNINYFYIASTFLAINTYAYHSQRLISIVLLIIFSLLNLKFKNIKKIIKASLIFLIILIPQILLVFTPAFSDRAAGLFYADRATSILAFSREFFAQYFNYFSPNNLFIRGDQDMQRSLPFLSTYYSYLVIPYMLGIYILFKNLKHKNYLIIFILFLVFPVVPALTRDPFSTLRNLSSIIPITIIIALGIFEIYKQSLRTIVRKKIFILISIFCLIISAVFLWRSYFVLFPYQRAKIWNYGYSELAQTIQSNPDNLYLIENSRLKPPYILLSFYMKLDPQIMQASVDQNIKNNYYSDINWDDYYKLANFETRDINWEEDVYKDYILVGDELSISDGQATEHFLEKQFDISSPTGEVIFVGYKTNPEKKCESIKNENEFCNSII